MLISPPSQEQHTTQPAVCWGLLGIGGAIEWPKIKAACDARGLQIQLLRHPMNAHLRSQLAACWISLGPDGVVIGSPCSISDLGCFDSLLGCPMLGHLVVLYALVLGCLRVPLWHGMRFRNRL